MNARATNETRRDEKASRLVSFRGGRFVARLEGWRDSTERSEASSALNSHASYELINARASDSDADSDPDSRRRRRPPTTRATTRAPSSPRSPVRASPPPPPPPRPSRSRSCPPRSTRRPRPRGAPAGDVVVVARRETPRPPAPPPPTSSARSRSIAPSASASARVGSFRHASALAIVGVTILACISVAALIDRCDALRAVPYKRTSGWS